MKRYAERSREGRDGGGGGGQDRREEREDRREEKEKTGEVCRVEEVCVCSFVGGSFSGCGGRNELWVRQD